MKAYIINPVTNDIKGYVADGSTLKSGQKVDYKTSQYGTVFEGVVSKAKKWAAPRYSEVPQLFLA